MDSESLLSPAFIRELEALRRQLDVRARSGAGGEHLAKRKGGSSEFQEHRPYAPGDDLRRIDWAAYARSGEPIIKQFRSEEDVVARLVVDRSRSLDFGTPSKIDVALRFAAAIGYMALARSERAQLAVVGEGLGAEHRPMRGKSALPTLLRSLSGVRCEGGTDLARGIDAIVRRSARPGLLCVFSDFLDGGPLLSALDRAASAGHDVALMHIVSPSEVEPDFEGDWALEDAETGELVEVTLDAAALEAYALRFRGLCDELRTWAKRRGGRYVRHTTDEPLPLAVRRFVLRATD